MSEKKKMVFIPLVLSFFTLISAPVVFYNFYSLAEGSFLWALMEMLWSTLPYRIGMFGAGVYLKYSLLPYFVLLLLLSIDSWVGFSKFVPLRHTLLIAGLFLLFSKYFSFSVYIGLVLLALYVFLLLRAVSKFARNIKIKSAGKKKTEAKKKLAFGEIEKIPFEEAVENLKTLTVPEFTNYKNTAIDGTSISSTNIFEIAHKASDIDRAAYKKEQENTEDRSKITSMFNADFLKQVLQEEKKEETAEDLTMPEDEGLEKEFDIDTPPEVEVHSEPIVDEGTEAEEDIEEIKKKYKALQTEEEKQDVSKTEDKNKDYISGVMGLKSARNENGEYFYRPAKISYKFPSENLLKHYNTTDRGRIDIEHDQDGLTIVETLKQFRVETRLIGIQKGPTFTLYELALAKGIRINSVLTLADNIAMDLAVPSVRILAPIPGKAAIGIEVPNRKRDTIGFDTMMPALKARDLRIPMVLGKTITGESIIVDLAGAPHMLIAGTTGSGKSVCVNSLICSVLYTKTPAQVRMILVDPKMVELTVYNDIPHLLTPVITDAKKAIKAMAYCVEEMERRMGMFSQLGARNIETYNQKIKGMGLLRSELPYIMVIIDEFADLMMVVGKELESYIKRITAVARFTGIHLVLATQRPSADIITGIIKSNLPTQIAFAVSNQVNSRIILDTVGAEKLLGRGDMLYASSSNRTPQRIQGAYIDTEIESIVSFVKTQGQPDYIDESYFEDDDEDEEQDSIGTVKEGFGGEDLFTRAWKIVADRGEASASYLQRRLQIGYNRAANLIEQLEEAGYIGPARGSKPREILRYPEEK